MNNLLAGNFALRDWPRSLRLNALSCKLARDIYQAACDVDAPGSCPFEDLEPRQKDRYILCARDVIEAVTHTPQPTELSSHVFELGIAINRMHATSERKP